MSGMKIFGDYNVSLVVGYVCAVIGQAGGALVPLFQEMMENQNGRNRTADQFAAMRTAGAPRSTAMWSWWACLPLCTLGGRSYGGRDVKQAIYISINGAGGRLAINYASPGIREAPCRPCVTTGG